MTFAEIPWLELTIAIPLFGGIGVSFMRDRLSASRWCLGLTGVAFVFAVIVWLGVEAGFAPTGSLSRDLLSRALGRPVLAIDSLSAPLLPLVALLHFLTALATARIKSTRYSFTWLLLAEALWLATFACVHPWVLGCLLALSTFPPYLELLRCGRPTRVYILHMAVFLGLLFAGLLLGGLAEPGTVSALLMLAVLVRTGTFPTHVWVTDLFENCFFGTALLTVTPIVGVYVAIRLVVPSH